MPLPMTPETPLRATSETPLRKTFGAPLHTTPETPLRMTPEMPLRTTLEMPLRATSEMPLRKTFGVPLHTTPEMPLRTSFETFLQTTLEIPQQITPETSQDLIAQHFTEVPRYMMTQLTTTRNRTSETSFHTTAGTPGHSPAEKFRHPTTPRPKTFDTPQHLMSPQHMMPEMSLHMTFETPPYTTPEPSRHRISETPQHSVEKLLHPTLPRHRTSEVPQHPTSPRHTTPTTPQHLSAEMHQYETTFMTPSTVRSPETLNTWMTQRFSSLLIRTTLTSPAQTVTIPDEALTMRQAKEKTPTLQPMRTLKQPASSVKVMSATTRVTDPSVTSRLTAWPQKVPAVISPVIGLPQLTPAPIKSSTGPLPPRPTKRPASGKKTTQSRTTTPSKHEETEKPGCPWRRSELSAESASSSAATVGPHKLQPCVLELCKFFSQCLCRPSSQKSHSKRYCDDSHLWYEKHASEICGRVKRVSFSRNLKQRCLSKMCSKL
uniref:HERV-H LTR-associating 1 n=3 Tax=Nothobranchius furzeri TaxID=105023 RepID=A0A1A8B2X6_NOTFU